MITMNAAQAHEFNLWVLFIVIGLPVLVVFGGHLLTSMAIALASLALLFSHPALAIVLGLLWLFPWRWALDFFIGGYAAGLGFGAASRRSMRMRYPRRRAWSRNALDAHAHRASRPAPLVWSHQSPPA
jgi:hypothetical protein